MKVIYIDTETTGLNPNENGMIEIAAIIEQSGTIIDEIVLELNPLSYSKPIIITPEALEVNGRDEKDFPKLPNSERQFKRFIRFLNKHIDRFDKTDKLKVIGYNVTFDIGFIEAWFKDNGNDFYGAYFYRKELDVFALVKHLTHFGLIDTEDEKLGTICEHFGIEHGEKHTAKADIIATRELYTVLRKKFIRRVGR